jgi:hypothetical protein
MRLIYADGTPVPTRQEKIDKAVTYVSLVVATYGTYKSIQHLNSCWKAVKETRNG